MHLFFFFFFFEFRPDSAVSADTDRVGPISATSAPISAASARVSPIRELPRGTDARSAASLPRPATSDAGALAWEPRPCILDSKTCMVVMELVSQHLDE